MLGLWNTNGTDHASASSFRVEVSQNWERGQRHLGGRREVGEAGHEVAASM